MPGRFGGERPQLVAQRQHGQVAILAVGEIEPLGGDDGGQLGLGFLVGETPDAMDHAVGGRALELRRMKLEGLEQRVAAMVRIGVQREHRREVGARLAHRLLLLGRRRRLRGVERQDQPVGRRRQAHARDEALAGERLAVQLERLMMAIDGAAPGRARRPDVPGWGSPPGAREHAGERERGRPWLVITRNRRQRRDLDAPGGRGLDRTAALATQVERAVRLQPRGARPLGGDRQLEARHVGARVDCFLVPVERPLRLETVAVQPHRHRARRQQAMAGVGDDREG